MPRSQFDQRRVLPSIFSNGALPRAPIMRGFREKSTALCGFYSQKCDLVDEIGENLPPDRQTGEEEPDRHQAGGIPDEPG